MKYETAGFAWKDAQTALKVAEAQLTELQKNDALRKAAMEKLQKTKLVALKENFKASVAFIQDDGVADAAVAMVASEHGKIHDVPPIE